MHIKNNKSVDTLSEQVINIGSDESNQIIKIIRFLGKFLLHGVLITLGDLFKHIFDSEGPPNLGTNQGNHTELLLDPVNTIFLSIEENTSLGLNVQSSLHLIINLAHEILNLAFNFDWGLELVFLTFVRGHVSDNFITVGKSKLLTVIKQLQHVWLNSLNIGATKNLEQIFIGNEVESWRNEFL